MIIIPESIFAILLKILSDVAIICISTNKDKAQVLGKKIKLKANRFPIKK